MQYVPAFHHAAIPHLTQLKHEYTEGRVHTASTRGACRPSTVSGRTCITYHYWHYALWFVMDFFLRPQKRSMSFSELLSTFSFQFFYLHQELTLCVLCHCWYVTGSISEFSEFSSFISIGISGGFRGEVVIWPLLLLSFSTHSVQFRQPRRNHAQPPDIQGQSSRLGTYLLFLNLSPCPPRNSVSMTNELQLWCVNSIIIYSILLLDLHCYCTWRRWCHAPIDDTNNVISGRMIQAICLDQTRRILDHQAGSQFVSIVFIAFLVTILSGWDWESCLTIRSISRVRLTKVTNTCTWMHFWGCAQRISTRAKKEKVAGAVHRVSYKYSRGPSLPCLHTHPNPILCSWLGCFRDHPQYVLSPSFHMKVPTIPTTQLALITLVKASYPATSS